MTRETSFSEGDLQRRRIIVCEEASATLIFCNIKVAPKPLDRIFVKLS